MPLDIAPFRDVQVHAQMHVHLHICSRGMPLLEFRPSTRLSFAFVLDRGIPASLSVPEYTRFRPDATSLSRSEDAPVCRISDW